MAFSSLSGGETSRVSLLERKIGRDVNPLSREHLRKPFPYTEQTNIANGKSRWVLLAFGSERVI